MTDILEKQLLSDDYITQNDIEEIKSLMSLKDYNNFTFEDVLIKENYLKEAELIEVLHIIFNIPVVNLENYKIDYNLLELFIINWV